MSPNSDSLLKVTSENGHEGQLSADALGITGCLHNRPISPILMQMENSYIEDQYHTFLLAVVEARD
ncbi:MAG: hypothetical protein Q7K13_02410 [Polynucleobacter sp.]|uniref:hypothetical protein n=1 Tax=Polynucleobacter sp. TaxID=2029855 RepID=UPI00271D0635|nr:hypothetical protein [Polynucleobacter sp.]MDO8713317.1 hypothetical protein [Polynucleobacter sp.]